MEMQTQFHVTTTNGRQRATWLELFGTDTLPVTAARPREVFYRDGRSEWVYDLDTAAIGEHGRRRLAAYIAARRWGVTFEQALRDVGRGWAIKAADCRLVENSPAATQETAVGPHLCRKTAVCPARARIRGKGRAHGRRGQMCQTAYCTSAAIYGGAWRKCRAGAGDQAHTRNNGNY
jgi:hypothetical protein